MPKDKRTPSHVKFQVNRPEFISLDVPAGEYTGVDVDGKHTYRGSVHDGDLWDGELERLWSDAMYGATAQTSLLAANHRTPLDEVCEIMDPSVTPEEVVGDYLAEVTGDQGSHAHATTGDLVIMMGQKTGLAGEDLGVFVGDFVTRAREDQYLAQANINPVTRLVAASLMVASEKGVGRYAPAQREA